MKNRGSDEKEEEGKEEEGEEEEMNFCHEPFFFKFYFIFKLYNIVLAPPNIEMNLPQVHPCPPS